MGRPPVTSSAAPRATLIMPKVEIKGGSRPRVIRTPLSRPQRNPLPRPALTASGSGTPACNRLAITTPERARTEPTERSIPAVMMTKVIPAAMMAMTEDCSTMLRRFERVRK